MNATLTLLRTEETSLQLQARLAGVIALITTMSGYAAAVRARLFVDGDAAATAHNILANPGLLRLAVAGDVVAFLYIAYTLLLYNLFKPVDRNLSLLAMLFSLAGCAVGAVNCLLEIAPLVILSNAHALSALDTPQLQALALIFVNLYTLGSSISMVLFGVYNALIGTLIFRSALLPRVLGALLALSGVCYLINSFAVILAPAFEAQLVPYILIPGATELVVALWLAVAGVRVRRYAELAGD